MTRIRHVAAFALLLAAAPAFADVPVGPFEPRTPPEDVPHSPPRPQPKAQPSPCGVGAGASLAGIAAVWGLTLGSARLRRGTRASSLSMRR